MLDTGYLILIFFILGCLVLAFFLGRSPVRRTLETRVTGKRVRYQETITASGNAYVPVKSEVFTIDTEITFDVPVSKALWDKLESGDRVVLDLHLNGEYSFKRRVKE
ncbi:MAG: hypothetical protein NTV61_08320 [Candidatus Bathyarchaeota archaeon]|nr:hypothetical protein [Candidatus Bathyarchaeota archaeon]